MSKDNFFEKMFKEFMEAIKKLTDEVANIRGLLEFFKAELLLFKEKLPKEKRPKKPSKKRIQPPGFKVGSKIQSICSKLWERMSQNWRVSWQEEAVYAKRKPPKYKARLVPHRPWNLDAFKMFVHRNRMLARAGLRHILKFGHAGFSSPSMPGGLRAVWDWAKRAVLVTWDDPLIARLDCIIVIYLGLATTAEKRLGIPSGGKIGRIVARIPLGIERFWLKEFIAKGKVYPISSAYGWHEIQIVAINRLGMPSAGSEIIPFYVPFPDGLPPKIKMFPHPTLEKNLSPDVKLTEDEVRIIKYCEEKLRIQVSDVATLLNVSKATALRRLNNLVRQSFLIRQGKSNETYYILPYTPVKKKKELPTPPVELDERQSALLPLIEMTKKLRVAGVKDFLKVDENIAINILEDLVQKGLLVKKQASGHPERSEGSQKEILRRSTPQNDTKDDVWFEENPATPKDTTRYYKQICALLLINGPLKIKQFMGFFGITMKKTRTFLNTLIKQGYIKKKKSKGETLYEMNYPNVAPWADDVPEITKVEEFVIK